MSGTSQATPEKIPFTATRWSGMDDALNRCRPTRSGRRNDVGQGERFGDGGEEKDETRSEEVESLSDGPADNRKLKMTAR